MHGLTARAAGEVRVRYFDEPGSATVPVSVLFRQGVILPVYGVSLCDMHQSEDSYEKKATQQMTDALNHCSLGRRIYNVRKLLMFLVV